MDVESTADSIIRSSDLSKKRRFHNKTRQGCLSCKLRRVKCDERKPGCSQCRRAHVECKYVSAGTAELMSSHEQAMSYSISESARASTNSFNVAMINNLLWSRDASSTEENFRTSLNTQGLDQLFRFQQRDVPAFGPHLRVPLLQLGIMRLVAFPWNHSWPSTDHWQNPFLMHAVMVFTAMHDRHCVSPDSAESTVYETYHNANASRLLNRELSKGNKAFDQDAVWMTTILISWTSMFAVETNDPESVWPLASTIQEDIAWLRIQKGLAAVYQVIDLGRPGSYFEVIEVKEHERCLYMPPILPGIDGIPPTLVELCGLDENSTQSTNPYHKAVHQVSLEITKPTLLPNSYRFHCFVNETDPEFERLLTCKDPRALVLMALWYGIVPRTAWYITLRAQVERKAICMFLRRYYSHFPLLFATLETLQPKLQNA